MWLSPGTTHLLGRTTGRSEAGERIRYIEHKSVSRKHLTIEVSPVKVGDSTKLHARPEITVKDGSKIGTTVNGDKFSQDTRTLTEKEYTIKLGNYEHLFHLWWHPVTLSFTSLSKKSGRDALAPWREKMEQAGIKLAMEYVTNETTHVIAKKRNTVAVLQGLLQARWVDTDGFAEALATAVARRDGEESSPLEDDFDSNWPKEDDFFVPSGAEPKPKPNEYLQPDLARSELFQDFIFVFMSQGQYDTLLSVVTAGGGKALLREYDDERTTVEEFVDFVKELAGRKNSAQFRLSQQTGKGGIVVVRMQEREESRIEFMRSLDVALDQRSIEQNEFLDAILTVDASGMRRQLEEEPASPMADANSRTSNSRPQSQQQESRQQRAVTVHDSPDPPEQEPPRTQPQPEQPEQAEQPSAATKRRNRRIITQSRFKGFDDFDPSQFSKPVSQSPEPSASNREASQAPSDHNMDVDDPSQQAPQTQRSSRKRPAPPSEEPEDEEDLFATILPGHAAMKRQKTLAAKNGNEVSLSKAAEQLASEKAAKAKKKTKQMDVKAEIEARRQAEEERYRQDQEALRATIGDEEMKNLKNLAIVEEMELPARQPIDRGRGDGSAGRNDRWDPAWNGRKNFKKFRPQGQRGEDGPRLQRVIVALEEVPRKGHGIGEEYWLNSSSKGSNKSKSQSQSQSQSVRQGVPRSQAGAGADEEDVASFRRRQSQRDHDEGMAPMEDILPEEIAGVARDEEIQAMANANSSPSQTMRSESQRKASGKRPAAQPAAGAPATKKTKQSQRTTRSETINVDDDDDDDALKFRRRRRAV